MKRLLTVVLLLVASPAGADVIELKTGQRIEGALKQATPASVAVEVGGQTITFEGEKVRAIYFGAAPASATPPKLSQDALRALKGLESVTKGGVTYRDYGPRVSDAKITVDRYLQAPEDSGTPAKTSLSDAMGLYVFAGAAWSARITNDTSGIISHPMIERCPALRDKVSGMPVTGNAFADVPRGVRISFEIQTIWSCASDQLTEAEKLLGSGSSPSIAGPRPAPDWCKTDNVVWQGDRCVEKK